MAIRNRLENIYLEKEVIRYLCETSRLAAPAQMVVFFIFFLSQANLFFKSNAMLMFAICINIAFCLRFLLAVYPEKFSLENWRTLFTINITSGALLWSAIFISCWSQAPAYSDQKYIYFLLIAGILASLPANFLVSKRDFIIYVTILILTVAQMISHLEEIFQKYLGYAGLIIMTILYIAQHAQWYKRWLLDVIRAKEMDTILNAIPGGISVISDGKYEYVNKTVANYNRVTQKEMMGIKVGHKNQYSKFSQAYKNFVNSPQKKTNMELSVLDHDQPIVHYFVMEKVEDMVNTVVVASINIQEIKDAQNTIDQQKNKITIASKMAMLGEMSSGVAHEINTPICTILSNADLIEKRLKKGKEINVDQIRESNSVMIGATNRIASIVKALKQFSRNSDDDPFVLASVSSIVEEALLFCSDRFKSRNISLDLVLPENDLLINCKATQIGHVILNLLNNAQDAVANLPDKWVRVEVIVENNLCLIKVIDSGKGIPKELQEKLMLPFFTTKEIGKGSGLGLSASQGIVELHKGTLTIDNSSYNTCFVIGLPLTNT